MATHCKNCGEEIDDNTVFCPFCGDVLTLKRLGDDGDRSAIAVRTSVKKKKVLITFLIILLIFAIAVGTVALLNANLLLPWQKGARRNRRVILEYAREHYPNAIVVEEKYNSAKLLIWNNIMDYIIFNYDGLEFGITAEQGKVIVDGYSGARAIAQFDKIIQDGFLKPRGITAYTSYMFVDSYREIYPYTGGLDVQLTIRDQGSTPQEFPWLYDFYKYWRKEGEFLSLYSVEIRVVVDKKLIWYTYFLNDEEFLSEDDFYSTFKEGYTHL